MTHHLVLGAGNLGTDLVNKLSSLQRTTVALVSRRYGFDYPESDFPDLSEVDVIWNTIGAGSVSQAEANYTPFQQLHVDLNREIASKKPPKTKFIWFSTDYVANENLPQANRLSVDKPRSLYAKSKYDAEKELLENKWPNTFCVRVGSLYGSHKPSFPQRLRQNFDESGSHPMRLPINRVSPTPTAWLAKTLVNNFDALINQDFPIQHCGPLGTMTVQEWGTLILGNGNAIIGNLDTKRPETSYLDCSFMLNSDNVFDLWEKHRV